MRAPVTLALTACLAFSLAACGDSDDKDSKKDSAADYAKTDADQIQDDVIEAMTDLDTVRLNGAMSVDGDEIEMDVVLSTSGDCQGDFTLGGMGSMELLKVDGVEYFKPDAEFWRGNAGPAADQLMTMVGDKWVTNSEEPGSFSELCDLDGFLEGMFEEDGDDEDLKVEGADEFNGTEAVKLSFTSEDGNEGLVYVAATEPHYLLGFEVGEEGDIEFTDFNEDLDVEAPDSSEVFDLASL